MSWEKQQEAYPKVLAKWKKKKVTLFGGSTN
jgi:hypothetical protein